MIFVSLIVFCITGVLAKSGLDSICYSDIKTLPDTTRDVSYIKHDYMCDAGINRDWYTFGPNKEIPRFCPRIGQCATDDPLWTIDPMPSKADPAPRNISLCRSWSTNGISGCFMEDPKHCFTVQAAYCPNKNSVVYYLRPPPECNMRYCYEYKAPCPTGTSSPTGYQPHHGHTESCQTNAFPFEKLVNGTTTYATQSDPLFAKVPGVSLKCILKCPVGGDCANVAGDVYWYSKHSTDLIGKTDLKYDSLRKELYSGIEDHHWSKHVNSLIYCEIMPRYKGNQPGKFIYTEPYYAGLFLKVTDINNQVSTYRYTDINDIRLTLTEADGKFAKLEIYSNLPLLCVPGLQSCTLDIGLAKQSKYESIRVEGCNVQNCNGCLRQLPSQLEPKPSINVNWQILPAVSTDNLLQADSVKISLIVRNSSKLHGEYWKSLYLPLIHVDYIPKNLPINVGRSLNDPHLMTHDGTFLEFHGREGEYLVMENIETLLRIHSISQSCVPNSHIYCNSKLFIQSIDDLVYHDITKRDVITYVDLSTKTKPHVSLPFNPVSGEATIPGKSDAIRIFNEGAHFKIVTHFGTMIKIEKSSGNFYIYTGKHDLNNVKGYLGDYNKNAADDLNKPGGGGAFTADQFFDQFKVNGYVRPNLTTSYYPITQGQLGSTNNLTRYCMCTNFTETNNQNGLYCPLGLVNWEGNSMTVYPRSKYIASRLTMNTLEQLTNKMVHLENIKKRNVLLNRDETKQERQATSTCLTALSTSELQKCKTLVEIDQLIASCQTDFTMTGSDSWTDGYVKYATDVCKTKLSGDKNNFVSTARGIAPQTDLLRELCPNKCNNNGVCNEEAKCVCNAPFDGYDCSVDTSKPAQIYASSSQNNICDSANSNCLDILLLVDRISSYMMIEYETFVQMDDGSMMSVDRGSSDILLVSENIIYGKLEKPARLPSGSLSELYFHINVKDTVTSNKIVYKVINSY